MLKTTPLSLPPPPYCIEYPLLSEPKVKQEKQTPLILHGSLSELPLGQHMQVTLIKLLTLPGYAFIVVVLIPGYQYLVETTFLIYIYFHSHNQSLSKAHESTQLLDCFSNLASIPTVLRQYNVTTMCDCLADLTQLALKS